MRDIVEMTQLSAEKTKYIKESLMILYVNKRWTKITFFLPKLSEC